MDIKVGETVFLKHYSGVNPVKSIVSKVENDTIILKVLKDMALLNMMQGDPVVFQALESKIVNVVGCTIVAVDSRNNILTLTINEVESSNERRRHMRIPVSLAADIKYGFGRKKSTAIVKDLSPYGMLINSKADLEIGERVEFFLYLDKEMLFLNVSVARKTVGKENFDYGVSVINEEEKVMNSIKNYINRILN